MKQYSFNLPKHTVETFQKMFPERHRARTIRKYFNQKDLTLDAILNDDKQVDMVVHPFWLYDSTSGIIDDTAKKMGLNKSIIMRQALNDIINTFKPINPEDYIFRTFIVKKGTKDLLEKYVSGNERNEIVEDFILDQYRPNKALEEIKKSPGNTEQITFTLHKDAYERLDNFKEDLNEKGISRTKLLRDALDQLINTLEKNQKDTIKEKLEQTFYEYKEAADPLEVKETLVSYLSDLE